MTVRSATMEDDAERMPDLTIRQPSRSTRLRPLVAGILALAAAMGIGRFAYTPLLPAMQAAARLDTTQAGLLAAANYAGYLAGAILAALAVPRAAQRGVLRASAVAVVATTAAIALTTNAVAWGGIRFLAGVASAGVLVLASGFVLDGLRRHGLSSRSGWLYSGVGVGIVGSGVVVGATAGRLDWRWQWALLAALAAAALAPCWVWLPRSPGPSEGARPMPTLATAPTAWRLLFAAYFLEGVGYIVTGTFLVAIVEGTPGLAGLGANVWVVVGLAVIPSSVLWIAVGGRVGYARALAAAYALQGCGIVLPVAGGAGAAFASAILFGGTFAGITALTLTLAAQLAPHRSATLIGLLTAVFGVGQALGPVLAGAIAGRTGGFAPALTAASALVFLGGILMALLHTRQGAATADPGGADTGPEIVGPATGGASAGNRASAPSPDRSG
jgi:predicted MFS family arabinose efflux permease